MCLEFVDVVGSTVGQGSLELRPYSLVRIQVGCVGRESFQVEPRKAAAEFPNRFTSVLSKVIPDDEHVSSQMAQEVAEELADLGVLDVLAVELDIEADAAALRTDRNAGDGGDTVVPILMSMNRRLAARSPRPTNGRNQEEA